MLAYVHIPFCHRVCPYCSFYKHTPGNTPIGAFLDALGAEAAKRVAGLDEAPRTLYLGGGTPSMLSPAHLRKLFHLLGNHLDLAALEEVTLEANPATFDEAKAGLFRELGVTRVSLGIQSFDTAVLQTLGREHDPAQAAESVRILQAVGMPQVNIDLMFSIPGQTLEQWRQTLQTAIALEPDHISAYNLTYEEDTAFFESLKQGAMNEDEERDVSMFELADEQLGSVGYEHYETSNYAKPGRTSSHNKGYWNGEAYLGLGPSAVSTLGSSRYRNVPDTAAYIRRIGSIGHAIDEVETLMPEALRLERIAMGLRTSMGIPLSWIGSHSALEWLEEQQMIERCSDRIRLIGKGRALVDPIVAELA